MAKLLVFSEDDPAGRNIASHLLEEIDFVGAGDGAGTSLAEGGSLVGRAPPYSDLRLVAVRGSLTALTLPVLAGRGGGQAPRQDQERDHDLGHDQDRGQAPVPKDDPGWEWVLCLSRHRSESGKRCLTAHSPGNLRNEALLGGNPGQVGISNPCLQSDLIRELRRSKDLLGLDTDVSFEATHHGPTALAPPVTFVEIGSDEGAWNDNALGEAVARAVASAISKPVRGGGSLGLGGGHYPEKFTSLVLSQQDSALGHIIPKYAMAPGRGSDYSILRQCARKTFGGCSSIVVDWKGTPSAFKEYARTLAEDLDIDLIRI